MRRHPSFVEPIAAQLVQRLPEGSEWIYELKLDGYRALAMKFSGRVQLRSRNNKDLTAAYPSIVTAVTRLKAESVMLDGEIVAVGEDGRPSFQALQHRAAHPTHSTVFYAFDLLHLDGEDLTTLPLVERKKRLEPVVKGSGILLSQPLPGSAAEVSDAVSRLGLEGVIAKRKDSPYRAGLKNAPWVKLKLDKQQEFVVGGYRPGAHGIDALIVGYHEGGRLRFAAKVRAGFTPHLRREVFTSVQGLETSRCPFVDLPHSKTSRWGGGVTAEEMAEMRWVQPVLVAQIRFVEFTAEGHLRHSAFLGMRMDKKAKDVRREAPRGGQ